MSSPQGTSRKITLPCCIVDDHCDTVPFLHALWKAKRIQFDNLSLLHVDSHPDLVPPACSVTEMHDKELLYDLLEECGGISEFLVPLVVNGHFGGGVTWLHQPWADQFPVGSSAFYIGDNEDGVSGVTSRCSYYLDEGLSYSENELTDRVQVSLLSCHDDFYDDKDDNSANTVTLPATAWILDICLDYFTVANPHLSEVEAALREHGGPSCFLEVLTDMFRAVRFRSYEFNTDQEEEEERGKEKYSLADSRREQDAFSDIMNNLLEIDKAHTEEADAEIEAEAKKQQFLALFDDVHTGAVHPAVRFLDTLSHVPTEVKTAVRRVGVTMLATLPHHVSTWPEIEGLMLRFEKFIRAWTKQKGCPPEAVCIARSDGDGFTECSQADALLALLLSTLRGLVADTWFSDAPLSAELTVCDMVQDPFLTAHTMFKSTSVMEAIAASTNYATPETPGDSAQASSGRGQPSKKKPKLDS